MLHILTHQVILRILTDHLLRYPAPATVDSSRLSMVSALLLHNLAQMANRFQ